MSNLADLAPGTDALIAGIASAPARRDRLAAFGLVPGTMIRLLQTRPTLVISVERMELAIDPRIGAEILVA